MVSVYGIKNCDSVKKALKFFDTHNIPYVLNDFKTSPVDSKKIVEWLQTCDGSTLFNAKSTTYRNLNLKSIVMDDSLRVQWMAKENLLIKRPVIEYNSNIIVGFNSSQYEGIFLT